MSALGPARVALAVCDAEGRFDLRSLTAGPYLLRAHLEGFAASRHWVEVKPNTQTVDSFILRRGFEAAGTADASVPSLVEAGFVSSASHTISAPTADVGQKGRRIPGERPVPSPRRSQTSCRGRSVRGQPRRDPSYS